MSIYFLVITLFVNILSLRLREHLTMFFPTWRNENWAPIPFTIFVVVNPLVIIRKLYMALSPNLNDVKEHSTLSFNRNIVFPSGRILMSTDDPFSLIFLSKGSITNLLDILNITFQEPILSFTSTVLKSGIYTEPIPFICRSFSPGLKMTRTILTLLLRWGDCETTLYTGHVVPDIDVFKSRSVTLYGSSSGIVCTLNLSMRFLFHDAGFAAIYALWVDRVDAAIFDVHIPGIALWNADVIRPICYVTFESPLSVVLFELDLHVEVKSCIIART